MRSPTTVAGLTLLILFGLTVTGYPTEATSRQDQDVIAERFEPSLGNGAVDDFDQLSEADLEYLLESLRPGVAQLDSIAQNSNQLADQFPKLSATQRRFAVSPAFRSFYDASFRREEGIPSPGNDEVEDPVMASATDFRHPKKAAYGQNRGMSTYQMDEDRMDDMYFTAVVAVGSALCVVGIVGAGFCYHRVRRNSKASEDVDYPAYGVTGPGGKDFSPTSGADRKLAQNAQMYHYQHQKQQMIAFDSASDSANKRVMNGSGGANGSDIESDDGEEADYTVYECPGLAPAGEMEVHNPLFQDDATPKGGK